MCSDRVEFFPTHGQLPAITPVAAAVAATDELTATIRSLQSTQPTTHLPESSTVALERLSHILNPTHNNDPSLHGRSPRVEPRPNIDAIANCTRSTAVATIAIDQHALTNFDKAEHFANAVIHPTTGKAMSYRALITDPLTKDVWS